MKNAQEDVFILLFMFDVRRGKAANPDILEAETSESLANLLEKLQSIDDKVIIKTIAN